MSTLGTVSTPSNPTAVDSSETLDPVSVGDPPSSTSGFDQLSDAGPTAATTTDAVTCNSDSTGAEPARLDPPAVSCSSPHYDSTATAAAAAAAAMATFDYLAGMLSGASQSLYNQLSPAPAQIQQDAPRRNSNLPVDAMNALLTAADPSSNAMDALAASTLLSSLMYASQQTSVAAEQQQQQQNGKSKPGPAACPPPTTLRERQHTPCSPSGQSRSKQSSTTPQDQCAPSLSRVATPLEALSQPGAPAAASGWNLPHFSAETGGGNGLGNDTLGRQQQLSLAVSTLLESQRKAAAAAVLPRTLPHSGDRGIPQGAVVPFLLPTSTNYAGLHTPGSFQNCLTERSSNTCTKSDSDPSLESFSSVFAKLAQDLNPGQGNSSVSGLGSDEKPLALNGDLEANSGNHGSKPCRPTSSLRRSPTPLGASDGTYPANAAAAAAAAAAASLLSAASLGSGFPNDSSGLMTASFAAAVMAALQQQQQRPGQRSPWQHQKSTLQQQQQRSRSPASLLPQKQHRPNSASQRVSHMTTLETCVPGVPHHRGRGRPPKASTTASAKGHISGSKFGTSSTSRSPYTQHQQVPVSSAGDAFIMSSTATSSASADPTAAPQTVYATSSSIDGTITDVLRRLSEAPNDMTARPSATPSPTLRKRRREAGASITSAGLSPSWPSSEETGTKQTSLPLAAGGLSSLASASVFQPKHESPGHKRSRGNVQYTESGYRVPLALGWRRETLVKGVGPGGLLGEVVYITPCGKQLWNLDSVREYLRSSGITILTTEDFTFKSYVRLGDYYECNKNAKGFVKMSESSVDALIATAAETPVGRRHSQLSTTSSSKLSVCSDLPSLPNNSTISIAGFPFTQPPKQQSQSFTGDPVEQVIVPGLAASSCGPNPPKVSFENDFAMLRSSATSTASAHEFALPRFFHSPPPLSPAMASQMTALWSPWLPPLGCAGGGDGPILSTATSLDPPPPPPLKLSDLPSLLPHQQQQALGLSSLNSLAELEKLREFFLQLVKDHRRLEDEKEVQLKTHRRTQLEKLKEQRIEKLIQAELKRPVEDLRLLNQEPLPAFDQIKGNKMSSKMFADCLLTVEFLHVFTEVLCIDSETIPSLGTLQSALVDRNRSCLDAVTHVIVELLKFAILDPGIPSPRLVTQLLGLRFSEMEVNSSTVTGLLRVFLIGRRGYEDEMSDWLAPTNVTHLSELSGDKLAALLAFVCDELVCSSRLISTEIDRTIDLQASLRREKFNLENKIRRIRILLARKFGADMNVAQLYSGSQHNTDPHRLNLEESSRPHQGVPSPTESIDTKVKRMDQNHTMNNRDIDDTEPTMCSPYHKTGIGSESGTKCADVYIRQTAVTSATCFAASPNASAAVSAAAIAAAYASGDEEDVDTAEELEKRLETLNQVLEAKQLAIDECSYRLSGIYLGQDRYFRNYFVLGSVGGIFVEGQDIFGASNSSQEKTLAVRKEGSGTLFDPDLIVAEIKASRELAVKRHYNFSGTAAGSSTSSSSFRSSRRDAAATIHAKPEPVSVSVADVHSPESAEGGDNSESPTSHPHALDSKQEGLNFGDSQTELGVDDSASCHELKVNANDHPKTLSSEPNVEADDQDPTSSKETCSTSPTKNIEEGTNHESDEPPESSQTVGTSLDPSSFEPVNATSIYPVKCEETCGNQEFVSGSNGNPGPEDAVASEGDSTQSSCQPLDLSNKKIQNGAALVPCNDTSTPSSDSFTRDIADYILWNSFTEQDLAVALEESGLDESFLTTAGLLFATQTGLLDRASMGGSCSLNDPACHVVVLFYKLQILRALAYEMKKSVAVPKGDQTSNDSLLTSSLRQLKVWLSDGAVGSSEDGSRFCDSDLINVNDTELLSQVDELLEKRGVQLQPLARKELQETNKDDVYCFDVKVSTHLPPQEFTNCWWRIHDLETLQSLLGALSPRGIRERMLIKSIQKNEETVGPSVSVDASAVIDLHTVSAALADGWSPSLLRVRSRRGKGRGSNVPFLPTSGSSSSLVVLGTTSSGSALLSSTKLSHSCNSSVSLSSEVADRSLTAEIPSNSYYSLRQQSNSQPNCSVVHQGQLPPSSTPENGADDAVVTSMSSDASAACNLEQRVGLADADSGYQEFLEECRCLERIEGLVDRALSASLQVKGWQAPIKAMDDDSIHLIPRTTPKRSRFEQWPLDVARDRLRDLEAHLERRYLLPPLNCESHLDVVSEGDQEEEASTFPSPPSQEHAPCGTGVGGGLDTTNTDGSICSDSNSTPAHSETSEMTVSGPMLPHIRRVVRPVVPTSTCGRGTTAIESEASSAGTNGQSTGSAPTSSGSGQPFLPPALLEWRQNVTRACSVEALNRLAKQLEAAVAWDKSIMKAICQICRRDKNEAQLLLCDGCDHGYHTYCFRPPLISIPAGDWFCFNCISKATGKQHCFVCGGSRPVPPPLLRSPAVNNTPTTSSPLDPAHRLVVCYSCSRAVHPACLRPPVPRLPRRWHCSFCLARGATFERATQPSIANKSATDAQSVPAGTASSNMGSSLKPCAEASRDARAKNKKKRKLTTQVAISDKRQCIRPDFKAHLATNRSDRKAADPACPRGRRPKCTSNLPSNPSGIRVSGASKPHQEEQQQQQQRPRQKSVCRFSELLPKHQKQHKQRRQQRKLLLLKRQRQQAAKSLVCFSTKRPLKQGKRSPQTVSSNIEGGCNYGPLSPVDFDKEPDSANGFNSRSGNYFGGQNQPSPDGLLQDSDLGSVDGSSSLEAPSQNETRGTNRPKRLRTSAAKLRQPMNPIDLEFCRRATEDLIAHEASWPFRRPVSSKDVPLYRKVIKRPIDLSTILKRLSDEKARTYSLHEWLCDVRLIFQNCEVFNEDDSDIGRAGHFMHGYFESKWGSKGDEMRQREVTVCTSVPAPLTSSPNPYEASHCQSFAPPIPPADLDESLASTLLEVSADDQTTLALEESETTQPADDSQFDSHKNISGSEDGIPAENEGGGGTDEAAVEAEPLGNEPESDCPPASSSFSLAPYCSCPGAKGDGVADVRASPARDSIAT